MEKYRAIIKDLNDFERLKCDQFVAIGTKTVNGALKSNILKLEYANDSSGEYWKFPWKWLKIQKVTFFRCSHGNRLRHSVAKQEVKGLRKKSGRNQNINFT